MVSRPGPTIVITVVAAYGQMKRSAFPTRAGLEGPGDD